MKPTAQQCIGTTHEEAWNVGEEQLASHMASGTLPVFATPCMVALMEYTCMKLVEPCLEEGITTVGTVVNIRHVSPTPEGTPVQPSPKRTDAGLFFGWRPMTRRGLSGKACMNGAPSKPIGL